MAKPSPWSWRKAITLWTSKTGIDWQNYKLIFKDTLPPTITLAANQAPAWANVFGSLGYLVPLVSIISHPSPPRAEFLWIWVTNILGSCVSAAITALAMFCVIKGREQSGGGRPDDRDVPYNAVASTVAAIWLIIQVYITSAIRYKYPWTIWMTSACLIFSNYGMVYVTQFPNMSVAFSFLRQLLFAHLVAFGVSAGVSLCIFPSNSREPFYKTALACAEEMREALSSNLALMEHGARSTGNEVSPELHAARKQHKGKLDGLQTKLLSQLGHAQNEVAWGRLGPADLRTVRRLLEEIMIPLIGLCQVPDVMERALDDDGESGEKDSQRTSQQYRELLGSVIEPFSKAAAAADAGLECSKASIGVDLSKLASKGPETDERTSVELLQRAMDLLVDSKTNLLDAWRAQHGGDFGSDSTIDVSADSPPVDQDYDRSRSNLHMLLYTELLLWSICHKVQQLLLWIEELKASQRLEKRRLIVPEWANLKAVTGMLQPWKKGLVPDDQGAGYAKDKPLQDSSDGVLRRSLAIGLHLYQTSTRFLASPASGFGLRVSVATMSIAIVAFLPSSQDFYVKQHLVWAQYTIAFAMQGSAGQGVRALCFRVCGTVVAACLAWVSYYIVVGIAGGVLVFYWLSIHFPMYIMALKPRYYTVGTVSAFALTTILGNAMQPNGSGQTTIVLGAIRLLAIVGGCLLASFWTVFPFPASDLDGARKSLGDCFASLAEYHTGFHEIVRARLKEGFDQGSPNPRTRDLEDMHSRLFVKCTSHLQTLRTQLRLAKWNIHMDGVSFSRTHYEAASRKVDDLARNLQLMTFASGVFIDFVNNRPPTPNNRTSHWVLDFRNLFDAAQHEGFGVAALLSLLAYAVRNETPLPPKLIPPSPERLWKILDEPERVAQQITQVDDPGAATFALMRIGTRGLYRDLGELFEVVRDMVGEFEGVRDFVVDEEEL